MSEVDNNKQFVTSTNDVDEISLFELFEILAKRKSLILAIFLMCCVAASIYAFRATPVYRVSAAIRPGWIMKDNDKTGEIITFTETPEDISEQISGKCFSRKVIEDLGLDPSNAENYFEIDTDNPVGTNIIMLTLDTPRTEEGLVFMDALIRIVTDKYKNTSDILKEDVLKNIDFLNQDIEQIDNAIAKFGDDKKEVNLAISRTKNGISELKNSLTRNNKQIELNLKHIEMLNSSEVRLRTQLEEVRRNTDRIIAQRNSMVESRGENDTVALLLYSNTIQQNITYVDRMYSLMEQKSLEREQLRNTNDDLRIANENLLLQIENMKLQIEGSKVKLNDIDLAIKDKQLAKNRISTKKEKVGISLTKIGGIEVLQQPTLSLNPVKPKKKLVVALAGVLGIFMGVFAAFFAEFLANAKKMRRERVNQ